MSQVFNGQVPTYGGQPMMPMPFEVENIFSKPGDDRRIAIFYVDKVPDHEKSRQAGYPIWRDVVVCKHQEAGDNLSIFNDPVEGPKGEELKRRYKQAWAMFEAGRGGEHIGMPLNLLFPDRPSLVANLQSHGIHTVEELSKIGAQGIARIGMGADKWQEQAERFLAMAKDTAAASKAQAELAKRDEAINALTLQVQQLTELINRTALQPQPLPQNAAPVIPAATTTYVSPFEPQTEDVI